MRNLLSVLVLLSLGRFCASAMEIPLPRAVGSLRSEPIKLVHTTKEIDHDILETLVSKFADIGRLADPRQRFEATDMITNSKLPTRRLILAGVGNHQAFVAYEHGGRGLHLHFVILERRASRWAIAFNGRGFSDKRDFDGLLRSIDAGRMKDDGYGEF